jgi:hypothetical protein
VPIAHGVDHRFVNDGRTLVVTASLAKGWRKERRSPDAEPMKTYCFSEVADAEWQGGTIHISVSAFPRPGGLAEEWATPPELKLSGYRQHRTFRTMNDDMTEFSDPETVEDCCGIQASGGVLTITVDLLDDQGEKPRMLSLRANRGGDAMFEKIERCSVFLQSKPYNTIDIQFRATFNPPRKPAPVEYSFWNDFLPGGRPESNRRKF